MRTLHSCRPPVPRAPLVAALAVASLGAASLRAGDPPRDRYGGSTVRTAVATGAFRLTRFGDRHAFVTPDGGAFLALGVNHTHVFLVEGGGGDAGQRAKRIVDDLRDWGFNNAGYGAPREVQPLVPFFDQMTTSGCSRWRSKKAFKYEDVFSPTYARNVRRLIEAVTAGTRENPNLIGYFWTANPEWTPALARKRRGTDWVTTLRTLDADAPGREAYVRFLEERYGDDAARFRAAYGLDPAGGYAALDFSALDPDRPAVAADDLVFLGRIAERYYGLIGAITRELAPDRLILGERYALRDLPRPVLEAALPHIDVLSVQQIAIDLEADEVDALHEATGKPILIADHGVAYPTEEHPLTVWEDVEDAAAVGRAYRRFLETAFDRPYFVGYLRCQYVDRPYGDRLRQGLLRADGTPRTEIVEAMRAANDAVFARLDREPGEGAAEEEDG